MIKAIVGKKECIQLSHLSLLTINNLPCNSIVRTQDREGGIVESMKKEDYSKTSTGDGFRVISVNIVAVRMSGDMSGKGVKRADEGGGGSDLGGSGASTEGKYKPRRR